MSKQKGIYEMKKIVYLAGPIAGLNEEEGTGWRKDVASRLSDASYGDIVGISPLRCEPVKSGMNYDDPGAVEKLWSDPRSINAKNWLDTKSSDLVLAYLPKVYNDRRPSIGTLIEIGWTIGLNKPLIVVSDDNQLLEHPLIKCNAAWRLNELDDAVEVIIGLFGEYVS
jgi:nucleoside 2-deoxyribosyltransferase